MHHCDGQPQRPGRTLKNATPRWAISNVQSTPDLYTCGMIPDSEMETRRSNMVQQATTTTNQQGEAES